MKELRKKIKNLSKRTYSLKSNFFRQFLLNLINSGWIINQILIGIIWGEENYGIFSLIISLSMIFNYYITSGLSKAITRYIPSHNEKNSMINTIQSLILFILGIFISIIISIITFYLGLVSNSFDLILSLIYGFSFSLLFIMRKYAVAIGRANWGIIAEFIPRLLFFFASITPFFLNYYTPVINLIYIDLMLRYSSGFILLIIILVKSQIFFQVKKFNKTLFISMVIFSVYSILGALSNQIMKYLTIPLVNIFIGKNLLGKYSMALTLSEIPSIISIAIGVSLSTKFSADINTLNITPDPIAFSKNIVKFYCIIFPLGSFLCIFLSYFDILSILGPGYAGIPKIFSLMFYSQLILVLTSPIVPILDNTFYIKQNALFAIIASSITCIFWALTLNTLGILSIALGWFIGDLFYLVFLFSFTYKKFNLKVPKFIIFLPIFIFLYLLSLFSFTYWLNVIYIATFFIFMISFLIIFSKRFKIYYLSQVLKDKT